MKENLQWPQTLQKSMLSRGVNNLALARAINVSHVTVGNYLAGQFPKGDDLAAIADFLETTTDALLGRINWGGSETGQAMTMCEAAIPYKDKDLIIIAKLHQHAQNLEKMLADVREIIKSLEK